MNDLAKLKRENRELKKRIRELVGAVDVFLAFLDAEMLKPSSAKRGEQIGKAWGFLNFYNDIAKLNTLKVPLKKLKFQNSENRTAKANEIIERHHKAMEEFK